MIINRPGVAGAVLHTASSLINYLIILSFKGCVIFLKEKKNYWGNIFFFGGGLGGVGSTNERLGSDHVI